MERNVRPGKTKKVFKDKYDTTELNTNDEKEYIIHRDYAAHYFRYGFAARLIGGGKSVLEVGCGSTLPLAHTMVFGEGYYCNPPKQYVGIDYGKITKKPPRSWGVVHEGIDATSQETRDMLDSMYGKFDTVVSLEVIEHMDFDSGDKLLRTIHNSMSDDGIAIISTPVYNGAQARNHIYEYTREEFVQKLTDNHFAIKKCYGTFMGHNELKKALRERYTGEVLEEMLKLYSEVTEFYSPGIAAAYFAPAFPEYARNCTWVLVKE